MSDPDLRIFDHEKARAEFKANAARDAKAALGGFCAKMAEKIEGALLPGDLVGEITYDGNTNPWSFSQITVATNFGAQIWRTKMILNVSCLGNLFNQWPTTRVDREGAK